MMNNLMGVPEDDARENSGGGGGDGEETMANPPPRPGAVQVVQLGVEEDESDPAMFRSEEDLVKVLSQNDPNRMKLTKEEHRRAVDIKEMVEGLPDLDTLPDFMYAQLAIVVGDNVEEAIRRCYGMQEFRNEYNIRDTYEQGCRFLAKQFELFPKQQLSFSFSEKDGAYVFVHDINEFDPKNFTCSEMVDHWMISLYYTHIVYFPDLEALRKGIICIVECEGASMRSDVLNHLQAFFSQFLTHYPMIGKCRNYHTGTMVNVVSSILRKILPKELRDQYQVGLQFPGHMGAAFLTPTVEEANRRMLAQMQAALKRRYENEMYFSLDGYQL